MAWHYLFQMGGRAVYLNAGAAALGIEEDFRYLREATALEVAQASRIMDGLLAGCLLRAEDEERKADTTGREEATHDADPPPEDKFSERARIELGWTDKTPADGY